MESKSKWRTAGEILVVVFTVIAGISALGIWLFPDFDPFNLKIKKGHLKETGPLSTQLMPRLTLVATREKESRYQPNGNDLPTVISFSNDGDGECQIRTAEFNITADKKTPKRKNLSSYQPPNVKVTFKKNHYITRDSKFKLKYQRPHVIRPNEEATLEISIVEPKWVGKTYVGELTITYNDNQCVCFHGVELDVLPHESKNGDN